MIKPWNSRPCEIAFLLNPAFCGEILWRSIERYQRTAYRTFPYPLAYMVLPIILHRATRENLPDRAGSNLTTWLLEIPETKIGFAQRSRQLISITNEALLFLAQRGLLQIDEQAGIYVTKRKTREIANLGQGEVFDCYRKAEILGSMLAKSGSATTIYALWGVSTPI